MSAAWTRRDALALLAASWSAGLTNLSAAQTNTAQPSSAQPNSAQPPAGAGLRLSTFSADITCPIGHPLMGGGIAPARTIEEPLFARGCVWLGAGQPLVLAALDWCEVRNDAYARWRAALAEAAGTEPARVLVTSLHQHDTPIADLEAERLLRANRAQGSVCDPEFHEQAVRRVADAVRASLPQARRITHLGTGSARVERIASNRRYLEADGTPRHNRMSATRDPHIRDMPEGTVDPLLRSLSFWDGETPVFCLSSYATHPMSYYGRGGVNGDFVGLARRRRQMDDPQIFQVYTSGCSGNVTAGKYNDGAPANRPDLAERLYQAMKAAWEATRKHPLTSVQFRSAPLRLEPRTSAGFSIEALEERMRNDPRPFNQCLAALGLSWRKRTDAGAQLDVPVLDFGPSQLILLPAESYVEYQLFAQRARPESDVVVMGYGECAPGYIPTEQAFRENDGNLHDWCWVAPGCEAAMQAAITRALNPGM